MEDDKMTTMNSKEELELVEWLINRFDGLREAISNRAAIVLSADALLLAGATFLLDKVLSSKSQYQTLEQIILASSIGLTVFFLSLSIAHATTGIITVWKTSRELYGPDMPQRLFFHARDTVETFGKFAPFEERFRIAKTEEMITYALGELWTGVSTFHYRYQIVRRAIRFLLIAIATFLVSIVTLLLQFLS